MKIYYAYVEETRREEVISCDEKRLPEELRKTIATSSTNVTRNQRIVSRLLLMRALEELDATRPYQLLTSERGKIFLADGRVVFSLSHTKKYAACAAEESVPKTHDRDVSNGRDPAMAVGIDVEMRGRYDEAFVRRFFTAEEAARLRAFEKDPQQCDLLFTLLWTMKEAACKCLDVPLHSLLSLHNFAEEAEKLSHTLPSVKELSGECEVANEDCLRVNLGESQLDFYSIALPQAILTACVLV